MADEEQDNKKEQTEVFLDILKSSYKLRKEFADINIRFCDRVLKILERYK